MRYSIGEVSKITGIGQHTLRYYEKEGLLYGIERKSNGLRAYTDQDIELINVISCLKDTGMSIADIRQYVQLCKEGKDTFDARVQLFKKQREYIMEQINLLSKHLETAEYKIWYYENVEALGDESDPLNCIKMRKIYENSEAENKGY